MNELVNNGIKLSKLKINTGFIIGLPKKWLAFYQSLRNTNHVKEYELASLFGKHKYEENLINSAGEGSHKTHLERHEEQIETILNHLDELPLERIEQVEDKIEGLDIMDMINDQDIEHTIPPTPPPDYPLMNYLSGRSMKPLGSEPVPEKPNEMAHKRKSTSAAPSINHAAIRKQVADSVVVALEVQAATMANTDNTNMNTRPREAPVARKCSYKEFMSC
nr:retrovirus-related Pol polyprotein from transposon TNT 1-94 [Tanacetum cinerariifolium]